MAYQELSNHFTFEERNDLIKMFGEATIDTSEFLSITSVGGTWKNLTEGSLRLHAQYKWCGTIIKQYPDPFDKVGTFFQTSLSSEGVKAAVVYVGKNAHGVDCGWLLAWSDSKSGGRKVYASCGPKSKYDKIDWADIENKLNHSVSAAYDCDAPIGITIYAALLNFKGKDLLAATFRA